MLVLGLSYNHHDAAACLVQDGKILAASAEERFSRIKHDRSFPRRAIDYCLASSGSSGRDLDCVAFYEKPLRRLARVLQVGSRGGIAGLRMQQDQVAHYSGEGLRLDALLDEHIQFTGRIVYSEHHLSHAASAFLTSPFDEAATLTVDGVGEWATTALFSCSTTIRPVREILYPNSLGLFYSAVTAFLGFRVLDDEYKVMGLASFGKPRFRPQMEKVLALLSDGSFRIDEQFFRMEDSLAPMYSPAFVDLFGPPRLPGEALTERHWDIAASAQDILEQAMVGLARSARQDLGFDRLCIAGGVAYNCVANSVLARDAGFKEVWAQPAAGDDGGALGAALLAERTLAGRADRNRGVRYSTKLGPSFSASSVAVALHRSRLQFETLDEAELCNTVARLLSQGQIVGWFQGRAEFGPRALGSRSILANPCLPDMKDVLNRRVKFREDFRPFAPAVKAEAASIYFDMDGESPFMLFTPEVRPEWREALPSVTHVDGTARVQTVSVDDDPLFYKLLCAFEALSGVPILINTSFNVAGEPIVGSPEDAINCFLASDIDSLAMEGMIARKTT